MAHWHFETESRWEEIRSEAFQRYWLDMYANSHDCNPFFHPKIIAAWTDTYSGLRQYKPLYIKASNGTVEAFMPLVLWRRNWKNAFLRLIVPCGYSDFDYHDALFCSKDAVETSAKESFYAELHSYLSRSERFDRYETGFIHTPAPRCSCSEECPYIDLLQYEDYQQYFHSLSKKLQTDTLRMRRQLEEQTTVSVRTFSSMGEREWKSNLTAMLSTYQSRWPKAYIAPHLHENLLSAGMPDGLVEVSQLEIDGAATSRVMLFNGGNKRCYYLPALGTDYSKYSIGRLHIAMLIEQAFAEKVGIFDFLRGAEAYKMRWTPAAHTIYKGVSLETGIRQTLINHIYALRYGVK